MALPSNPTIVLAERWSTFYNTYGRGSYKYPLVNMEEDRSRLKTLREDWLTLLREASACSSDWPTTKTEVDQLMVLLRWDPSKMWMIAKESQIVISARDKTGLNTTQTYTTRRSEVPIAQIGQDAQSNPERGVGEEGSHHTTSLRPSIFPFAYIRTFYNELDGASLIAEELKAFAYEQSLKQIDIFYGRASNYCKKLQQVLQNCRDNLMASKLYDAFERDHQVLANHLNREWIIAVHDKMRELGITMPKDMDDGLDENDEGNNPELAADSLSEGSSETQSILTDSNATIMENETASQAPSSSTMKPESVRSTTRSENKMLLQCESEVETRARHHRPHASSNEPKQPSPVATHEHPHPKSVAGRKAGVQTLKPNNLQRPRSSGPVPEGYLRTNHSKDAESPFMRGQVPGVDIPEDVWRQNNRIIDNHMGLKSRAHYPSNHPGLVHNSAEDDGSSLTHRNLPGNDRILTSPPRYDGKPPPKEGIQIPANLKQSDHRRFYSQSQSAPAQLETRSADIEIRITTPLPYNKTHDSQLYVQRELIFIPQDSQVREPRIAPGHIFPQSGTPSRNVHPNTVENHEVFTPSYPTSSLKQHPSNVPLSKETPTRYAATPARTQYELGIETESLNHSIGRRQGSGRQSEPEQPYKRFSAADTVRNVPSTSNPNSLPSRQQRSHGPGFPSVLARSSNSVPYAEKIPPRKSQILQVPQRPHEEATAWHNTEDWLEYPAKDDQGQQFLSTSTGVEPNDTTQDIDWQAVDQMLGHMIENIYATDVRSRAGSYSQRMADKNHIATNMAADDQTQVSAEEGDTSLASSDDSDLTDSDDLDDEIEVYDPMDNPSILPIVNIDRTVPYAENSKSANIVVNGRSSETRKQSVSWGKAFVYPEVPKQRNRTIAQGILPQSALKR